MKKEKILLILIFLLALFLRIYKLGSIPHTFHEDEVLSGYVGRYIIQNGFDLYGNKWPLWYFNKFGDYYIIGPIYLSGLSTLIFGVNEFATRFPHAFFGALAIFPIFFFTLEIFKNKKIALLSSLFLAITPWHVVLSRSTTEGIIGTTLFLTSLALLFNSLKNKNIFILFLAFLFSLSTYWIYHPFRIYTPLIFTIFLIIFFNKIKISKKYLLSLAVLIVIFFSLTFYISQTPWGKGRFLQTSIFSPLSGVSIRLNELAADEKNKSLILVKIFHNKAIGYTKEFLKQYLTYFSPVFLTVNGWEKLRYHVPEQGPIYFSILLLIIFAITQISKEKQKKEIIFFFFLLFLSPFPASLTIVESPNVHRSLFMLIPLTALASFGFLKLPFLFKKFLNFKKIVFFIMTLEFIFFLHQYFKHADLYSSLVRNDGQKEIAYYVIKNENNYDQIFLPAEAAMSWYYLFYKKDFNPQYAKMFQLDARIKNTGSVYYVENPCPTTIINPHDFINKKLLVIDRYSCQSDESRWRFIKNIHGVNILLKYKLFEN